MSNQKNACTLWILAINHKIYIEGGVLSERRVHARASAQNVASSHGGGRAQRKQRWRQAAGGSRQHRFQDGACKSINHMLQGIAMTYKTIEVFAIKLCIYRYYGRIKPAIRAYAKLYLGNKHACKPLGCSILFILVHPRIRRLHAAVCTPHAWPRHVLRARNADANAAK